MDETPSKKVVVLGAGGFLGEHVVQALAASRHRVIAAVRPGAMRASATGDVAVREGDLLDPAFVGRVLEGADAAIVAAGRTWQSGLPLGEYHRQNVGITDAFFQALGRRPEVRVVFTSSLATISGSRTPHLFTEDSDRAKVCERWLNPYARAKILCERRALEAAARGNQVVVLNPGQLVGPGASAGSNLATAFLLLWFCQGKAPAYIRGGLTVSDVRDVARAHVAALTQGRSGQRYIVGGHCLDRGRLYALVCRLTGVRRPRGVPASLAYPVMALADGVARLSAGRVRGPAHRSFVRGEGLYHYGDSGKAVRELGYRITPLEVTIFDTLRHYQARGLLPPALKFLGEVTAEEAPAFVLLRRLAARAPRARFLLSRMPEVYAACRANRQLDATLLRLLEGPRADGGADPSPSRPEDLQRLHRFFEHLYFASNEFLGQVR